MRPSNWARLFDDPPQFTRRMMNRTRDGHRYEFASEMAPYCGFSRSAIVQSEQVFLRMGSMLTGWRKMRHIKRQPLCNLDRLKAISICPTPVHLMSF